MKCINCNKEFVPALNQIFCCKKCKNRYWHLHRGSKNYPPFEFVCSQCGKSVVTLGGTDKRSRFCSVYCEKKYWRHSEKKSSLTSFHSLSSYLSYEKHTNNL